MGSRLKAKRAGYVIRYVPHNIIADYNATYNVEYRGQQVITGAAKRLGIPSNEIWISELWKPYEEYILFHELREIHHRRNGLTPRQAHKRAVEDTPTLWKEELEFQRMITEIKKMDALTARKKRNK
jgi:competence protein ComEA